LLRRGKQGDGYRSDDPGAPVDYTDPHS
jgi:hypothetical protein